MLESPLLILDSQVKQALWISVPVPRTPPDTVQSSHPRLSKVSWSVWPLRVATVERLWWFFQVLQIHGYAYIFLCEFWYHSSYRQIPKMRAETQSFVYCTWLRQISDVHGWVIRHSGSIQSPWIEWPQEASPWWLRTLNSWRKQLVSKASLQD